MNKKPIYFLSILLMAITISACNQDKKQADNEADSSKIMHYSIKEKPKEIADVPWAAELDANSQKISMKKSDMVKKEDLDIDNVAESLNRKYPEIQIASQTQSNDTVLVNIPNATYLTQQSGNMGSEIYLAEATYSFTEIAGVNYVKINFKMGDHATPGTFKRSDFNLKDEFIPNKTH
ncbi:hypothetical protein I5M32_13535 [Pedobacter sp. SD-b]|uniref:Lipoprotein n=1 Tax=Pedobacter segetis TaxID=2793069 RepID=A0ABS1BM62_9SPHI|nr:hypothetical protein [Pedobacter segetis]MBK0383985.1 hypothetical protein [Pedobacter segetis]